VHAPGQHRLDKTHGVSDKIGCFCFDGRFGINVFFRGIGYGFLAGIVLTVLFVSSGRYGALAVHKPIVLVYFLAGLEVGIALIGAIVFFGLNVLQGWAPRPPLGQSPFTRT
jgi:hypothetical protein